MSCHVAIGELSWCRCPRPIGFEPEAQRRDIPTTCEHPSGATAVALVHLLQDFGVDARIVQGECEWNPAQKDLRKLRLNKQNETRQELLDRLWREA